MLGGLSDLVNMADTPQIAKACCIQARKTCTGTQDSFSFQAGTS